MKALALTPGEPAGIGPDLTLQLAQQSLGIPWIAIVDPDLMRDRARQLGISLRIVCKDPSQSSDELCSGDGTLVVAAIPLAAPVIAGQLEVRNSHYVMATLERATAGVLAGEYSGLVTGPVQKSVIADAGINFMGHTEWLQARTGVARVVMLLAAGSLRVALVTTHVPLSQVSALITAARLDETLNILVGELKRRFALDNPRVLVAGLNPHAGEQGHLGHEDGEIIAPVLKRWREQGYRIEGPLPADTLFTPRWLQGADAVLAMYHDQGLPVLKYVGFGNAVNVTLGLPIVRTSVDHGTALDLAGRGGADVGSLRAAMQMAWQMVNAGG